MSNDAEVRARAMLERWIEVHAIDEFLSADELEEIRCDVLGFAAEARSHDGQRADALAEALCLLDTFAGEGLCHVYGNGQTLDATDTCTQLAAAIGVECEPGWWRTVAAMVSAVPLFDEGRETG